MKTTNIHLTHLTIRCKYDYEYGQKILDALKYTSQIQFLTVDEYMWSIRDMNQIHNACSKLKKLHLTRATLLITPYHYLNDNLSMIKKLCITNPATSLYELKLQDVTLEDFDLMNNNNNNNNNDDDTPHDRELSSLSSSNWLLYIVLKYPYLEQLEWWHKSFRGQLFYPSIHPMVSNLLIQQCSQLNSICFFNINVNDDFYSTLLSRKKGPTIKNLGINHSIGVLNSATTTTATASHLSFTSSPLPLLSSFSLWWNQHENQDYVQFLPWKLTKLHLSGRICDGIYDLHFILDHCKYLEHLHIDFGEIRQQQQQQLKSSSYYHQTPQHCHPLKKLVMEEIKLTSNIMTTISCRCQSLIELDIIDCTWMENNHDHHYDNNVHIMDEEEENHNHHPNGDDHHHQLQLNQDKMNVIHIQFYHQKLQRLHLSGIRFSNNPLLRSKSIGIYEFKHPQQMLWYYLSHHATFLTYKPTLGYRYKHPVEVTQCHSIIKKYNDKTKNNPSSPESSYFSSPSSSSSAYKQQQNPSICLGPPVELNALREMQRQYGRYSRFQPCSGYVIFICQSVNEVYLENKIMLK
ncbi:unnamed protein product [Cunninghamella blakesleeana]